MTPPATEVKRTPLPWHIDSNGDALEEHGLLVFRPQHKQDGPFIVTACNSHAALLSACERAVDQCEKLRLTINPLLVELPETSTVNGEDNFALRLKVLKIQATAEEQIKLVRAAIASARKERV